MLIWAKFLAVFLNAYVILLFNCLFFILLDKLHLFFCFYLFLTNFSATLLQTFLLHSLDNISILFSFSNNI